MSSVAGRPEAFGNVKINKKGAQDKAASLLEEYLSDLPGGGRHRARKVGAGQGQYKAKTKIGGGPAPKKGFADLP